MKSVICALFKCCHCGCEKVVNGTYEHHEDEFRNYKFQELFNDGWRVLPNGKVTCKQCVSK
ncbi:hypothetical protein [Microviridae sp.]|nr:hypothetical protein [Microviridae sp.]